MEETKIIKFVLGKGFKFTGREISSKLVVSKNKETPQLDFFSTDIPEKNGPKVTPCQGCTEDNIYKHNGIYCLIRDWPNNKKKIRFIDLMK